MILQKPDFDKIAAFRKQNLSDYIKTLEGFKANNTNEVLRHWGSMQNFNTMIQKIKDDEDEVAKLAIKYPELDTSHHWAKVPSKALSDFIVSELKKEK